MDYFHSPYLNSRFYLIKILLLEFYTSFSNNFEYSNIVFRSDLLHILYNVEIKFGEKEESIRIF